MGPWRAFWDGMSVLVTVWHVNPSYQLQSTRIPEMIPGLFCEKMFCFIPGSLWYRTGLSHRTFCDDGTPSYMAASRHIWWLSIWNVASVTASELGSLFHVTLSKLNSNMLLVTTVPNSTGVESVAHAERRAQVQMALRFAETLGQAWDLKGNGIGVLRGTKRQTSTDFP
jgi:hypothetical protein